MHSFLPGLCPSHFTPQAAIWSCLTLGEQVWKPSPELGGVNEVVREYHQLW